MITSAEMQKGVVMDELIYKDAAISALDEHLDSIPIVNNGANNMIRRNEVMNCRIIVKHLPTVKPEGNVAEFEKGLHNMFDFIWDCEIDHPVFQDKVSDLMGAVIELYKNITMGAYDCDCTENLAYEWKELKKKQREQRDKNEPKKTPKEELLDDGTLVIWTNTDMTKFSRVNVRQIGTHYGDLFYPDED